jgi:hypothetical protein
LQSCDSLFFDFSLDLLPEEIFGIEEVPEYILSDSSAGEEDATPKQRTNHQLHCRIRHLQHDLRDISARCSAEQEHRMSSEALVRGKTFILIRFSCSSSDPMSNKNLFPFFRCV